MRFSSVTVASLLFSIYMSFTLAADTADDPKNVSEEAMNEQVDASLTVHKFPAVWTFELDDDFAETPELIAEMGQAFIASANEAHNSADMKFFSVFIKSAMHEHLTDESDNKKRMMMRDGEEEDDEQGEYYYGSDKEPTEVDDPTGDGATRTLKRSIWNRPANRKFGDSFRPNYTSLSSVGCNLCSNDDDDATAMLAHPFDLGTAFYYQEQGQSIQSDWQRRFCQKLRKIPSLEKARRCFIFFDLNHEDPGDNPQSLASTII